MNEYDTIEVTDDHLDWSPPLHRGTQSVIVDLPGDSDIAKVEVDGPEERIEIYMLHRHEMRVVDRRSTSNTADPD